MWNFKFNRKTTLSGSISMSFLGYCFPIENGNDLCSFKCFEVENLRHSPAFFLSFIVTKRLGVVFEFVVAFLLLLLLLLLLMMMMMMMITMMIMMMMTTMMLQLLFLLQLLDN